MQHALVLNLIDTQSLTVSNDNYQRASGQSRTCSVHGFRVDKITGEIYGEFVVLPDLWIVENYRLGVPRLPYSAQQYEHLLEVRTVSHEVCQRDGVPAADKSAALVPTTRTASTRGPKPRVRLNPDAAIIKIAVAEDAHWIESAVMAAMYIAVEDSNGKLNIRPSYVRKVIAMPVISTESIAQSQSFRNHELEPVGERYIRYLAAAGRVALCNIERYLEAYPSERRRLEVKVLESTDWGDDFDLDEYDYVDDPYDALP